MTYRDPGLSADDLYLLELERHIIEAERKWKNEEKPMSFYKFVAWIMALGFSVGSWIGIIKTGILLHALRWFR